MICTVGIKMEHRSLIVQQSFQEPHATAHEEIPEETVPDRI